ncbi:MULTISPECIES: extracellular solute-binding protein [unclassified Bosea (in: a-proteobacteria)]|uniref:extracellular solute-binding protein n=1 Tax=unclassified Bosea (in: a-proteobacteria) TaxID=2653178 RepID=UPI000F75C78D|nr:MULTISPECIES: extracellular solute-binding protein [unclassified Bosea (in: a-proteobacteria)]AZO78154.1 ABC transporter substrate-binding protein [Bosea sp. Tri-49]RXT20363.1 ABC transporter substrate-binding protein [Bosea sp. Tri-39]RXT37235.1 ABC transporter substrate-binding protein [Bosea sp. Tri-54]
MSHLTRRGVIAGASSLAALSAGGAFAQGALPASPVALNIIDVAGNLQLTQAAIEKFAKDNPKLISRLNFSRAPSPELPAKLKAQQDANRVDIDMVLTGPGAMSDGIQQGLWVDVWKSHTAALPKAEETYHEQALMMQRNFGQNEGVAVVYSPSGPLFEYAPDRLKTVPKTAEEFLAYVKQNKNRFTYARPLNSGPGWTFLQGLPYILGDSDPSDPMNGWAKSWAYLKELGTGIDYYPGGTTPTMKELGEGTRDVIVSTLGWDINPRALGIVPKEAKVFVLANTHWIPDTQFMCIPKGVAAAKIPVILALMSYMLKPEAQAATYDKGYFYPGPAIKGVTLAMAPQESQDVIREYGRPEYDGLIGSLPTRPPLTPERLVAAFRRWDQEIGVGHTPK